MIIPGCIATQIRRVILFRTPSQQSNKVPSILLDKRAKVRYNGNMMNNTTYDFLDGAGPVPAHRHSNGGGWVADSAQAAASAFVGPFAKVFGNVLIAADALIYRGARVYGLAIVGGNAEVGDNARVYGNAIVYDDAQVYDNARVYGNAQVFGNALVYNDARVYGGAVVYGNARVYDHSRVCDLAEVYGSTEVRDNAQVSDNAYAYADEIAARGRARWHRHRLQEKQHLWRRSSNQP